MSFHTTRRAEFLNRPLLQTPAQILGNAQAYDVGLAPVAAAPGQQCWQVIGVYHLAPEENRGNHVVYVDVVDETGHRVRDPNLCLAWGWEGQRADEVVQPRRFDKPDNEPATNVEMYSGQNVWIRVEGDGIASDTVSNLHTKHADEPGPHGETWNSIGHHSFYVLFQRRQQAASTGENGGEGEHVTPVDNLAPSTFRFEAWPTEVRQITQRFGENPADYEPFGLPGHEGIDIVARTGTRVFAVAPGVVRMIKPTPEGHNYGIHVRVQHRDGYETIYAHLQSVAVQQGQQVAAGQLLGPADSTGNSDGSHLHLTLKRQGAQVAGYPPGIIDPMPFLQPLLQTQRDGAIYVSDVVADGTLVTAGARVEQRWTVRNTGDTTWGAGYVLAFESGVRFGNADALAVPATASGAEVTIPLSFDAPATPGSYRSYWKFKNPDGAWFGERLWVDINVKAAEVIETDVDDHSGEHEPVLVTRGNKLGFYLHLSTDQFGMWDAVNRVKPPVILFHADAANDILLQEIRTFRAPNAFVIGRWYVTNDEQRAMLESADPAGAGRAFAERILTYDFGKFTKRAPDGRPLVDAWMSLNECLPGPASASYREDPARYHKLYAAYDQFQVAFHARMKESGMEAIAFNFAAGNFTEAAHYLDFFPRTLDTYTYLGFHEYGWPSLIPGAGVATGATIYRRVLNGVRAQKGNHHRVIMTEAGLTRAYGHPFPDEGWLNTEQTLSEDQYWAALAWYNHQMAQDDYVLGACLYEVGHDGKWASFRHLGVNNQGHPVHLVEKLVALRESVGTRGVSVPRQPQPRAGENRYTLAGNVLLAEKGLANATVRIIGDRQTLGATRGAAIDAPGAVSWSRRISDYSGTLRNAWDHFVAGEVAGITWTEFKRDVQAVNPHLAATDDRFVAAEVYYLPEPSPVSPAYLWDRPLHDYSGSIYQAWLDLVQGKVPGLDYAAFRTQLLAYNPSLANTGQLLATDDYLLPRTVESDRYYLATTSSGTGRFRFSDLRTGSYTLEVAAPQTVAFTATITLDETLSERELDVEVAMLPLLNLEPRQPVAQARGTGAGQFMGVIGREFVVNRRIVRFIGVNLRGLVYYGSGLTGMLQFTTEGHRHETAQQAHAMGAKVVRVFLPCINASAEQTIGLLRTTLDILGNHNLYLIPAFVDFYKSTDFRIPGDDHFYARLDPNFHHELLKGDFYRGGYRERYLPFVQTVVEAFKEDSRIFAWEIGNELKYEPAHEDPNRAAFLDFMLTMARTIKQLDRNHLVTTGMISTSHASLDVDNLWRKLYGGPEFDFLTVHCYNDEYEGKQDHTYAQALNKPFIIEEAGYGKARPGNRVEQVRRDMDRWFGLGASGYMQWGFMPTQWDIGDGDDDAGMDRAFHGQDFDGLFQLYRERAATLQSQADNLGEPEQPADTGEATGGPTDHTGVLGTPIQPKLKAGETAYAQDWVNVRKSAGHVGKPGDDVVGLLGPGAMVTLTGEPIQKDGLRWWPINGTKADGETVIGWMAEATGAGLLLSDTAPALPRGASYNVLVGLRTDYAQSFINLRQSAGYVAKVADDVIGQILPGSPVTVLDGPQDVDELRWWYVRAPLLDNQVGTGWVAETAPNGFVMLAATPPETIDDDGTGPLDTPLDTLDTTGGITAKSVTVVATSVNLRATAGYLNQPPTDVVAELAQGTVLDLLSGPVTADGLAWVQVASRAGSTPALRGWLALADPQGTRLVLSSEMAETIQVGRPCAAQYPLTQGWGSWPEFYARFVYDGVPLKGHNGLDFGTPENTPVVACDDGTVMRVDFEPKGFGNFVILRHSWGESLYAHLNRIDLAVGSSVKRGESIALSGNTGAGTGAHLHFGIRITPYRRNDGWGGFSDPSSFMEAGALGRSRSLQQPSAMAPELRGRRRP